MDEKPLIGTHRRTPTTVLTIAVALTLLIGVGLLALFPGKPAQPQLPQAVQPHTGAQAAAAGGEVLGPAYSTDVTTPSTCTPDAKLLAARKALPYQRGINLSGLEHTQEVLPGTLGTDYYQVDERDMAYFSALGFTAVRLPISWERFQRSPNSGVNVAYAQLVQNAIEMADKCNLLVIVDLHDFGARRLANGRFKVGTTQVPISTFTDVWKRIAARYNDEPNVWGYDTMNEPGAMPYSSGPRDGDYSSTLSTMQRAAVSAIRSTGSTQWIMLEIDEYSGAHNFVGYYGANPKKWWNDPLNKTMVSAHYYFDYDHTGAYLTHWNSGLRARMPGEVTPLFAWGKKNGVPIFIGEYGVPSSVASDGHINAADIAGWHQDIQTFMTLMDRYGVNATYWGGGTNLIDSSSIEPNGWLPYTDYSREWNLTKLVAAHNPGVSTASIKTATPRYVTPMVKRKATAKK